METVAKSLQVNKRSDIISLTIVTSHLIIVFAPVYLAVTIEPSAIFIGLWLWFGLLAHGLINLMHEAAHWLVFRRRDASDFLGQWILGPMLITDFDAYRERHWIHHIKFGEDEDSKDTYLVNISGWNLIRFTLSCIFLVEAMRKFLGQFRSNLGHEGHGRSFSKAAKCFAIVQCVFASTLVLIGCATSSWDIVEGLVKSALAYFGVYVYGLGSLTVFVAALRAIAEHQRGNVGGVDVGRAALRNLNCNLLTRFIFGTYGFSEHATHHQRPNLPSYQLEQATRVLAENNSRLAPYQGYMTVLSSLWLYRIR